MNIVEKIDMADCTGCHSCYNICPVYAIHMESNSEGFLIPNINEKKCIHCGNCIKVCPVIRKPMIHSGANKVFAMYSLDEERHKKSASGGLFATAAEFILTQGGYAVGAAFDEKLHLRHIIIDTVKDLPKLVGTKYVQSEIGDIYVKVKKLLNTGKKVLFSGTACQVAGLKMYLQKDYENLYSMDLICHGVPSPLVWETYLKALSPEDKVIDMTFRDKSKDNAGWPLVFRCESGKEIKEKYQDNRFIKGFIKNLYLRQCCYRCKYKGFKRCSDITIGDFWGLERFDNSLINPFGTSVGIIHSENGMWLFNNILDKIQYKEMPEEIVSIDNSCLIESVPLTKKRKLFFKYYRKWGFFKTIDKLSKPTLFEKILQIKWKIRIKMGIMIKHWRKMFYE